MGMGLTGAAKVAGTTKFALPADEDGKHCADHPTREKFAQLGLLEGAFS